MIGKKNIVFGFIYLVLTAALGPYMVKVVFPDVGQASTAKQKAMADLQLLANSDFTRELEPLSAEDIAKTNTNALLKLNQQLQAESVIDEIKGGPHTHGNLESLLNIAVGLTLCFIAGSTLFKQAISWIFILGTLLHSGMLYLSTIFHLPWAQAVLGTGIGPVLILLGLLLTGIAAAIGFQDKIVRD